MVNKKIKIIVGIIITLLILFLFINIFGMKKTESISVSWGIQLRNSGNLDIQIIDVKSKVLKGNASDEEKPLWVDSSVDFNTKLESLKDSIEYKITLKNLGKSSSELEEIKISNSDNESIIFRVKGLKKENVLEPEEEITFTVVVTYNKKLRGQKKYKLSELNVKLDYVEVLERDSDGTIEKNKDNVANENNVGESKKTTLSARKSTTNVGSSTTNVKKPTTNVLEPIIDLELGTIFTKYTAETGGTYPWTESNGVWKSGNKGKPSSTSELSFNFILDKTNEISFDWTASSESVSSDYVYYTIYKDGKLMSGTGPITKIGGTGYGTTEEDLTWVNSVRKTLEPGTYKITFTYRKNATKDGGTDTAYVKNFIAGKNNYVNVKITYPSGCKNGTSCTYSVNEEEHGTTSDIVELKITDDTKLIAKALKGKVEKTTKKIIDFTAPIVSLTTTPTTNAITAAVDASDTVSEIFKYEFCIDDGEWVESIDKNGKPSNKYTFSNLKNDKKYIVKTRVTNSSNLETVVSKTVTLYSIDVPTFTQSKITDGARVTITYPEGCGKEFTCIYIKNNREEVKVTSVKKEADFFEDGTLETVISDGINTLRSSYTVGMTSIDAAGTNFFLAGAGDGLYKDTYESREGKERYIFKGANPNNYITFNEEEAGWRIVSIESDGVLKIIRDNIMGKSESWDYQNTRDNSTSTYCTSAENYGCNAWAATENLVGKPEIITFDYITIGGSSIQKTVITDRYSGEVIKDASLNTYLNTTYYNGLKDSSKKYIISHIFNVGLPSYYTETGDDIDLNTTIMQEKKYQWNGKIGLVSASEIIRTTTNDVCINLSSAKTAGNCNTNNWMWTKLNFSGEWLISPIRNTDAYYMDANGKLSNYHTSVFYYYRPAFYLTSDITLSGSGTQSDPFTIVSE